MRRRPSGSPGRCSATTADPEVGRIRPSNMRRVVVLPAPLGPRNPKTSPRCTSRSRASTAVIDWPYRFVRPLVVMTFPFAIGISFTNDLCRHGTGETAASRHLCARSLAPLRGGAGLRLAGELGGAWLDQADLVGEDHRLDAVAQFQLVEHVGDVR